MAQAITHVILDDRLLIEELLVGLPNPGRRHTTAYWYYRACRAAVAGAGGHLSGPFAQLDTEEQSKSIRSLLTLRDGIGLPDPRVTVPVMADLSDRHPRLSLLNLEATAAAVVIGGTLLLSTEGASGILPGVLDDEGLAWVAVEIL